MDTQKSFRSRSLVWVYVYITLAVAVLTGETAVTYKTALPSNHSSVSVNDSKKSNFHNDTKPVVIFPSIPTGSENTSVTNQKDPTTEIEGNIGSTTANTSTGAPENKDKSRLNLAVIPVVGILVLTIGICLKCCGWLRRYTRGNKDSSADNYDIVEEGDTDFDQIEMRTDSASTVYYDTVSSFCSLLRRNEFDVTASTLNGPRFEQLKQEYNVSDKLLREVRKRMAELDAIDNELAGENKRSENPSDALCMAEIESEENQTDTSRLLSNSQTDRTQPLVESQKRRVTRTPSGSSDISAETEQSLISDTERDTPVKRQRFKVSFVTEDLDSGKPNKVVNSVNSLKPIINNTRSSHSTMTDSSNAYRQRPQSLTSVRATCLNSQPNDINSGSSKVVCKSDCDRSSFKSKAIVTDLGVRSKSSPISTKMMSKEKVARTSPLNREKSAGIRKALGGTYREVIHNKEVDIATNGVIPEMKDCATQTEKSFRLSIKRGRKRYASDTCTDENVIPPTINELVEMCSCVDAKNKSPNMCDKGCTCDNSQDDVADDVFEINDNFNSTVFSSATDSVRLIRGNDLRAGAENRHTNHERNGEINGTSLQISSMTVSCDKPGKCSNKDITYDGVINNFFAGDNRDKLSISTHNISDIRNDSYGNLLDKYCDKCHNTNKSVPNLCCACQTHPLAAEYTVKADNYNHNKNRCKSCSHFSWANISNGHTELHCLNKTGENQPKQYEISAFKRESSLASEDLSLSSSSLSSSGYVEISSDVSSA